MVNAATESTYTQPTRSATVAGHASEAASRVATTAAEFGQGAAKHYVKKPARDLLGLAKEYAKEHPDVAACWAFGIGILVGWKLKP